jgi:hypothetical protein
MAETTVDTLKQALTQALGEGQAFTVSSGGGAAAEPETKAAPVTGDTQAKVPAAADKDPLLNAGSEIAGKRVNESMAEADPTALSPDGFLDEEVTLTPDERDAFLDAVISGKRYEQPFSIYGGAVSGIFRSRSTLESEGIATLLNQGIRESRFGSTLEYSITIRNSLLAAQVKVLNGTAYTELDKPYVRTVSGDTVTEPGWLAQQQLWGAMSEPVLAALYEELKLFERKYWTMISHSRDQNFWHPAEST